VAGLNNAAVVERVLAEALEKRQANPGKPACLVIDGEMFIALASRERS
jgi:hypothetical protein